MKRRPSLKLLMVACGLVGSLASAVNAETLTYGADIGIGESDNITLVRSNPISQTLAVADLDFAVQQNTRLLSVDANGNFTYLDFLQHAYSNELVGRFDGLGKFAIIPERLKWVLQDDFGQAQIDPFAAVTPSNRETINYLSTGPDLTLRFGSVGFADVSARYARAQYSISPFDNNRLIGSVAVGRQLSPLTKLSLDGNTTHVTFDDTVANVDFNRSSGYADFAARGARTELTVDIGATRVNQGDFSRTGPLAKVMLSRKLSPAATLTFTGGRDQTDASTGFSMLQSGAIGTIGTAPAAITSLNYTVTYGSVGWQYQLNRSTLNLSGRWEKDAYDGQSQFDRTIGDAEFNIVRRLTHALSVQLLGTYVRNDYPNTNYINNDVLAGAAVTFQAGRGLEIRLRYNHLSRSVVGNGAGFSSNVVYLTVGYRPRAAAAEDIGSDF